MKKLLFALPLVIGLIMSSCGKDPNAQVISKQYIHKYGYAVSESEWNANQYPGQVITSMRDGVTVKATYENGVLHGPTTYSHPHSQTVQHYYLYHFGEQKKEVSYDSLGMPIQEKVQLSPTRFCLTKWYGDGSPLSIEDFTGVELLDGQYFTLNNEPESRVERGVGVRILRDQNGTLLSKDQIDSGYMTKREAYFPSGKLESISHYAFNKKNGERKAFTDSGFILAVEEWVDNQLYGKATYYTNGKKQTEVFYINGARNGLETHYVDGDKIEQEIYWTMDRRHGPTHFYVADKVAKTEWFHNGKQVSKKRFDELDKMDQLITDGSSEFDSKKASGI